MTKYRDRQEGALDAYRAHEAEWTTTGEEAKAPAPLTVDQARMLVERFGGWQRLEQALEDLMEGAARLRAALEVLRPVFGEGDAHLQALEAAIHAADSALERATDAEQVLEGAGLVSSGDKVKVRSQGRGQPKDVLTAEVESAYRRSLPGKGPWRSYPNTKRHRDAIRRDLDGRFPAKDLTDAALRETLRNVIRRMRQSVPPT